ncbi:hypothetical protein GCM10011354_24110 [Egicoccus halophilus]|uniref:Uncharacterized protein n=2 Tax=Egicoccus halophilus TaxID=1670830 RepID=A0A8J3ABH3_9ACTN|nr:hypothetical protein GCM10011354_24110 [Egicoccus halophilus]
MDGAVLVVLAVVAIGGLASYAAWRHRQALQESMTRLLEREPGLRRTDHPAGLDARELARGFAGCPKGDRRYGVRHGVEGPLSTTMAGEAVDVHASAFEWWWEERRQNRDANGNTTTSYVTRRTMVGVTRLPVRIPDHVSVGPESVFGRLGLSRRDHQLESDTFNRRFRVVADDRMLTVQLLDARLQQLLLDEYTGRTVELTGDLLVLAGDPSQRDDSLTGCIGRLPAVRQDTARLLAHVPTSFWRAVDHPR